FGPSTRTRPSPTCTLTPAGTVMGSLPMRDMVASLPDRADDLAADVLAAGIPIDQDALGRREDVHAEPAPHGGDVLHADVDAEARPAHAPHPGDHGAALPVVAQIDAQDVARRRVHDTPPPEIALVDEDARDLFLLPRPRHVDVRLARVVRVPDAGEQIGDGIGHHGGLPARLREARDLPPTRQVPETEPAHAEAAEERTRPSAERAAVVRPHLELRRPR